jgi:2'-5' RNA ligase
MHKDGMASDAGEYWRRRREITPDPSRPAVADGDRRLALLVDVADPAVVSAYDRLADRLDDFRCLATTPPEELHLTVKVFGGGVAALDAGETGTQTPIETIDESVAAIAEETTPFEVQFPQLNLFPDTVYAETNADGVLAELNRRLCDCSWSGTSDRDGDNFIPHLTVGYLTSAEEYDALVDFLEANRTLPFPSTTVTELSLVAFDVTANWRSASTTLRTYAL